MSASHSDPFTNSPTAAPSSVQIPGPSCSLRQQIPPGTQGAFPSLCKEWFVRAEEARTCGGSASYTENSSVTATQWWRYHFFFCKSSSRQTEGAEKLWHP